MARGGGEHGSHGLVLGPDNMLYAVCGNFTAVPNDLVASSPHRKFADDLALPRMEDGNGFGAGAKTAGWLHRANGSEWSEYRVVFVGPAQHL